jgi:hypothetical protein
MGNYLGMNQQAWDRRENLIVQPSKIGSWKLGILLWDYTNEQKDATIKVKRFSML